MSLKSLPIIVLSAVVLMVLAYGGLIVYFSRPITFGNIENVGVFGDSFGVLTSLFSGLAFASIVLTILLQREELQLQRKELQLTREEFRSQHSTIKRQNFESTFFQMLRLHNDILSGIDLAGKNHNTGRDCFVIFLNSIKRLHTIYHKKQASECENMNLAYSQFWTENQKDLGHYFRYLYIIFEFIKGSDVTDKKMYSNIVRAQLSDQELAVLFYNCLYNSGEEKFKPLIEEFAIFNDLPVDSLISPGHKELYRPEAFGETASQQTN